MTKKYTLTTSEETVTENPEDIIRLMKLAGLTNAQPVAEEEVTEEWANTPDGHSGELELDPTDFEKKTGDNITKQNKSLDKAPSKGDNPLEYSLDENEIYEAMMKEFKETEEVSEEVKIIDLGRRFILAFRQNLVARIQEHDSAELYKRYQDMEGEIIAGEVHHVRHRELIIYDDEGNESLPCLRTRRGHVGSLRTLSGIAKADASFRGGGRRERRGRW